MISWLQGEIIEKWKEGQKEGSVINCGSVGYEVQLLRRQLLRMQNHNEYSLWVHQLIREDGYSLFGFIEKEERDLFRKLISVSGIGPQMAMSLLDEFQVAELVLAIIKGDLRKITKANGIGKRTAERLAVELRKKLANFNSSAPGLSLVQNEPIEKFGINPESIKDLQTTLTAIGYEDLEIRRAIRAVYQKLNSDNEKGENIVSSNKERSEEFLKEILIWLSQEVS